MQKAGEFEKAAGSAVKTQKSEKKKHKPLTFAEKAQEAASKNPHRFYAVTRFESLLGKKKHLRKGNASIHSVSSSSFEPFVMKTLSPEKTMHSSALRRKQSSSVIVMEKSIVEQAMKPEKSPRNLLARRSLDSRPQTNERYRKQGKSHKESAPKLKSSSSKTLSHTASI